MDTLDLLCVTALAAGAAIAHSGHAQAVPTKFDGTWGVTLVCADYKGADANAKGYTFRFLAYVKDGRLEGQYGKQDEPARCITPALSQRTALQRSRPNASRAIRTTP